MNEFKVNQYITLKLEDGTSNIYVADQLFRQCKIVILDIPVKKLSSFDEIDSIDEAIEELGNVFKIFEEKKEIIPPEVEFWGHCSNLQVWDENNYDTRLLHRNLAFPLLKNLADAGDDKARRVFKEEIVNRVKNGHWSTIEYLMVNNFLEYLNKEEFSMLIGQIIIEIFENKNYQAIIDFIQCDYRGVFIRCLNEKELSDLIENPKMNFFQTINETISYLEQVIKQKIELLQERVSVNQNFDEEIQKYGLMINKVIWGFSESEVSALYSFFRNVEEIAPQALINEVIRNFKIENIEIINIILQMDLYWAFSPEMIDTLEIDVKKNFIKHLIKSWGDEEFYKTRSNFNEYIYGIAEGLLKGKEDTVKILQDQIIHAFETGTSKQIFDIFRFVANSCIEILDLNNLDVIRGLMRLTEESEDNDNNEMYYTTDMREKLFSLGSGKNDLIFDNITQILSENHLKDLKSLIMLRWLEFFNLKQLKLILDDKEINFIEKITTLLLNFLNDKDKEYFILEDYVGLLHKILLVENGIHITNITNELKERIIEILRCLNTLSNDDYNKSIKDITLNLIKVFSKKLLNLRFIEAKRLFPVLIDLIKLDISPFKEVFKEEIIKRFLEMKVKDIKYILKNRFLKKLNKIELRNLFHDMNWDKFSLKIMPKYHIKGFLRPLIEAFYVEDVVRLEERNGFKFKKKNLSKFYKENIFVKAIEFLYKNEFLAFSSRENFLKFIFKEDEANSILNLEKKYEREFPMIKEINAKTSINGILIKNKSVVGLSIWHLKASGFPEMITQLRSLKLLFIRNTTLITIPSSICKLTFLEELVCDNCSLLHVPESIKDLKRLRKLHLKANAIMDLPISIAKLQSLEELNIENNEFIIPEQLSESLELKGVKITI
ncbi:hypothetical protein LCGC14_1294280 [marine sediment metagenome]|uniref:Disease resistance R13L4/SHOC-2-like LRR domain-containing protein n=1 Tax=marine sediment metagenome TaxID=412755 RepID=A0A0F9KRR1_9ZZZZ